MGPTLGKGIEEQRESSGGDTKAGSGLGKERGAVRSGKSVEVSRISQVKLGGSMAEKGKQGAGVSEGSRSSGVSNSRVVGVDAGVVEQAKRKAILDPVAAVAVGGGGTVLGQGDEK